MTNKELFRDFSKQHEAQLPFSLQFNWWNEVVKNNWEVAIASKGDQIQGIWPYFIRKKGPWQVIAPAYFTPFSGPFLIYPDHQKPSTRISYENKIYQELIAQLPKVAEIDQQFQLNFSNGLAFLWNGFQESVGYTYLLDLTPSKAELWNNLRENIRRQIKKAEKTISIKSEFNATVIESLLKATFRNQNRDYPIGDDQIIDRMVNYIEKQSAGSALIASSGNETHAAILTVMDAHSAYYLIGASDPKHKNSAAMSLLMWESILVAKQEGCFLFNFEGSVIPPIEKFLRGFGGELCPYRKVYKLNSKSLGIAQRIKG